MRALIIATILLAGAPTFAQKVGVVLSGGGATAIA
ncbi:MAG: hypothetical protein RL220_2040, partial [Bacteroidota bacterium]